jgi:hypothetical protein
MDYYERGNVNSSSKKLAKFFGHLRSNRSFETEFTRCSWLSIVTRTASVWRISAMARKKAAPPKRGRVFDGFRLRMAYEDTVSVARAIEYCY